MNRDYRTWINNGLVLVAFAMLLVLGLCVDSTGYRDAVSAGNLLALPMVVVTYSITNWCLLAVLATFIGEARKLKDAPEWNLPRMWQTAVFTGLVAASSVIFGVGVVDADQVLNATQAGYLKYGSPILLAGFGIGAWGEQVTVAMRGVGG